MRTIYPGEDDQRVYITIKRRCGKDSIYIMHEERKLGRPAQEYIERCAEGYQAFGFDLVFLNEAYEFSCRG